MDDKKFIKIMDENVKLIDGHYQLPLPFKDQNLGVPNNPKVSRPQTCIQPKEKASDK